MQEILRSKRAPITAFAGISIGESQVIALGLTSAFSFVVPATLSGSATVTFYGAPSEGEPFYPIYLSDGTLAEMNVTPSRIYVAPPELFSVPLVKMVSTTAFAAVIMGKG